MSHILWPSVLFLVLLWVGKANSYRIGVGIADVTGPSVGIAFLGYVQPTQIGSGIHLRQFARAFVIDDGERRFVFISVDSGMMAHGVKKTVLSRLKRDFGQTYTVENLMISATHTHSAPGGFLQHLMFDISTLGFVPETFEAIVSGIVKSVQMAHSRMREGKLLLTEGELLDVNINRTPTSYDVNPAEERARYEHNVDKTLTQLQFRASDGKPLGVINWFAIHPTSMNFSNTLISSDNVGYASILMEAHMNPNTFPGKGHFVAAFASSNLGDASPNTRGPRCPSTGDSCDVLRNRCPGTEDCIASGPGSNMFESTSIIAHKLMEKALDLWKNENASEVLGPIKVVHQFVDMPLATAPVTNATTGDTTMVHGCVPAIGNSLGSGTVDGPAGFTISELTRTQNPDWNNLRDFIAKPTIEDIVCHGAKPILLATGRMVLPYEWQPRIVPTQLALIGNLALVAVPGEFTTMAGRRLRSTVAGALADVSPTTNIHVVVAGLSNMYVNYIVTPEEYQEQKYEAASTVFGPHTLTLYLNQYTKLAQALKKDELMHSGPQPPDFSKKLISFIHPVLYDTPRWKYQFGNCIEQPQTVAKYGQTVQAKFISGNPRNNLMHDNTYLTVERRTEEGSWQVVATDANWETKFHWKRTSAALGNSEVTVTWTVPPSTLAGDYRIRHFGHYKYLFGGIFPYLGSTKVFKVSQ